MKKIFLAGISAIAASSAWAQSSVTLYGVAGADVTVVNNVQSSATGNGGHPTKGGTQVAQFDTGTSGPITSRWGLKGNEDLGGGLQAIFQLENGYSINNGAASQGGDIFGRYAYVGLSDSRFGTLTFGRQYDPQVNLVSPLTFEWYGGNSTTHPADYDNLNGTARLNNTIEYISNNYSGFKFGGLYSLGGVAGSVSQNQLWSVGAAYTGGAVAIAASIFNARDPNVSLRGTNGGASATANNFGTIGSATAAESNASIAGFASATSQQTAAVAVTYTISSTILGVSYSNTQYRNFNPGAGTVLNPNGYSGSTNLSTVSANVRYQATPALRFGADVDYTAGGNVDGSGGAKYTQFNLVTGYSLSKRTELFLTAQYQHASGVNSLGRPAVAQIGYLPASSSDKQVAVSAGLSQKF